MSPTQQKHRRRERNVPLIVAMARAGLDGNSLAAAAGVTHYTVSALVCCRRDPSPATAAAIARALGVPAAELFTESEVA